MFSLCRTTFRHAGKNITLSLADAAPMNYLLFQSAIFQSDFSFFQEQRTFVKDVIGVSRMEVGTSCPMFQLAVFVGAGPKALLLGHFMKGDNIYLRTQSAYVI